MSFDQTRNPHEQQRILLNFNLKIGIAKAVKPGIAKAVRQGMAMPSIESRILAAIADAIEDEDAQDAVESVRIFLDIPRMVDV